MRNMGYSISISLHVHLQGLPKFGVLSSPQAIAFVGPGLQNLPICFGVIIHNHISYSPCLHQGGASVTRMARVDFFNLCFRFGDILSVARGIIPLFQARLPDGFKSNSRILMETNLAETIFKKCHWTFITRHEIQRASTPMVHQLILSQKNGNSGLPLDLLQGRPIRPCVPLSSFQSPANNPFVQCGGEVVVETCP